MGQSKDKAELGPAGQPYPILIWQRVRVNEGWAISVARTLTHMNLWRLVSTVAWGEDTVSREKCVCGGKG